MSVSSIPFNHEVPVAIAEGEDKQYIYNRALWAKRLAKLPNYHECMSECSTIVNRTYEQPYKWFYLVFAPLDKPYDLDPSFYLEKGLIKCRSKLGPVQALYMTLETESTKAHINVICCSKNDLSQLNGKFYLHKYRIYATECGPERMALSNYIVKESRHRVFKRNIDYCSYTRPTSTCIV